MNLARKRLWHLTGAHPAASNVMFAPDLSPVTGMTDTSGRMLFARGRMRTERVAEFTLGRRSSGRQEAITLAFVVSMLTRGRAPNFDACCTKCRIRALQTSFLPGMRAVLGQEPLTYRRSTTAVTRQPALVVT